MAAAIMRWWQMIHNGGTPFVAAPVVGNPLIETTSLQGLVETTTGEVLIES